MSYTKTTWVNNTTPINDTNLNKIEQGIYDNSLVVDAVTNTINPTDTETYKTAELTEGQITDVIGVNDIVIKGDTSQDGTPTPSSPVDVNIVSGSNVINIYAKNILDGATWTKNQALNESNTAYTANGWEYSNYIDISQANYYYPGTTGESPRTILYDKNKNVIAVLKVSSNTVYNLSSYKAKYIRVSTTTAKKESTKVYQGKELSLDLVVENLFDEVWEQGTISNTTGENSSGSNVRRSVNYISVLPNTTYVFSRTIAGNTMPIREYGANKQFIGNKSPFDGKISSLSETFTTSSNVYFIRLVDFVNNSNNKVMIEQGSKANAYTPYGTEPIELCKIGDYQDYFYKSGSKWYLHKEINKKVLNGSENWQLANSGTSNYYYYYNLGHTTIQSSLIASTHYPYAFISNSNTEQGILVLADGNIRIRYGTEDTIANFKTWLASNNVALYYILATATDTEITDTTLISQLEAIYNAPLYEETNITQTNNDLSMILDITACKDNINGIKAFIRK